MYIQLLGHVIEGTPTYTHTHAHPHAGTYGEYEVDEHMEDHKPNQYPVHPFRQLRLGQLYREENGNN